MIERKITQTRTCECAALRPRPPPPLDPERRVLKMSTTAGLHAVAGARSTRSRHARNVRSERSCDVSLSGSSSISTIRRFCRPK